MFLENFATAKDYLDDLVIKAMQSRASDLHFENRGAEGIIRVRIEGVMREWARFPIDRMLLIVRRLKFISGLDPEHSGRTGEGRFEFEYNTEKVVMRISILPTTGSDDVVVRILGSSPESFGLKDLHFHETIRDGLMECVRKSMGLILVTGPTGSGKTSTLYAAVQEINDGNHKIITVEDPIEYKVTGLTQIKMDRKFDVTYSKVLHGVLRHDPDVILIGECRDIDAAEVAIESSMTGHLVLTTMHTNNAISAILRMINLGVSPVDVSNSLTAVYAQRLIPRLCAHCKKPADASEKHRDLLPKGAKMMAPQGCDKCGETGYKGRLPVGELLVIDDDIRDVIIATPALGPLNKVAKAKGFRTMLDYGLEYVAAGELDLQQVLQSVV